MSLNAVTISKDRSPVDLKIRTKELTSPNSLSSPAKSPLGDLKPLKSLSPPTHQKPQSPSGNVPPFSRPSALGKIASETAATLTLNKEDSSSSLSSTNPTRPIRSRQKNDVDKEEEEKEEEEEEVEVEKKLVADAASIASTSSSITTSKRSTSSRNKKSSSKVSEEDSRSKIDSNNVRIQEKNLQYPLTIDKPKIIKELLDHPQCPLLLRCIVTKSNDVYDLISPTNITEKDILTGMNAIHFCVLSSTSSTITDDVKLLKYIISSYKRKTMKELQTELQQLESERSNCISALRERQRQQQKYDSSKTATNINRRNNNDNISNKKSNNNNNFNNIEAKVLSVNEWFDKEKERRCRQAEFRIETWWNKTMKLKDYHGRTCIHLCIILDLPKEFLNILLNFSRGIFSGKDIDKFHLSNNNNNNTVSKNEKLQSFFTNGVVLSPGVMYDIRTGRDIVVIGEEGEGEGEGFRFNSSSNSKNSDNINSSSLLFNNTSTSNIAEPKNKPFPSTTSSSSSSSSSSFGVTIELRSILWDLPENFPSNDENNTNNNSNSNSNNSQPFVNYEVVVPWVMRNILKCSAEFGARYNKTSLEYLKDLIKSMDETSNSYNNESKLFLILPELKLFLGKLHIRVTKDVLKEMCRMYPADINLVRDKWNIINEKQNKILSDIKKRKDAILLSKLKSINGDSDNDYASEKKGSNYNNNSERGNMRNSYSSEGKSSGSSSNSSSKGNYDSDDEDGSNRMDAKATKVTDIELYDMDSADDVFGIDLSKLLDDLSNGLGIKSSNPTFRSEHLNYPAKLPAGKTLQEEKRTRMNAEDSKISSDNQNIIKKNQKPSAEMPSCVSLSTLQKARRSIVNLRDCAGRTALYVASCLGRKEIVELLLAEGGDISLQASDGGNAINVAKGYTIKSLLEKSLVSWLNRKQAPPLSEATKKFKLSESSLKQKDDASDENDDILSILDASNVNGRSKLVLDMQVQLQQLKDRNWSYSRSPLSWAVNNGLVAAVKEMVNASNVDVNVQDTVGRSPLHECLSLAGTCGKEEFAEAALIIAEDLISSGANVNAASVSGRTPLHEMFCRGPDDSNSSFTRISTSSNGSSGSYYSSIKANNRAALSKFRRLLMRHMLQWGANPLIRDRHGIAPIHYCARENMAGCMLEMLRAGYSGSYLTLQEQTPLHIACKAGATKVAHLLCRWDADHRINKSIILKKDKQKKLPIQLLPNSSSPKCLETLWGAVRCGNINKTIEIVTRMNATGGALWEGVEGENTGISSSSLPYQAIDDLAASLNFRSSNNNGDDNGDDNDDELTKSLKYKFSKSSDELWLIDGIDTKSRRSQWTALHACICGLAEYEATVGMKSSSSSSSVKINQQARIALELPYTNNSSGGSSSKSKSNNLIGNLSSSKSHHLDILKFLLQNRAYVDCGDINYRTPLMLAAACNLHEACSILLDAGADVDCTDLDGNSALHHAYMYGSSMTVSLIESRGGERERERGASGRQNNFGNEPFLEAGRVAKVKPLFFKD